jgi:hypothetical protein
MVFMNGRSTVSNLVQFTNDFIGEIEDGWKVEGFQGFRQSASRSVEVQFVNVIWWVALVLDGVLSDRSNTTYQIGVLFVGIDLMSLRGYAEETNILHFGY